MSEQATNTIEMPNVIPVLATKDLVAFPSIMISLYVESKTGQKAAEKAAKTNNLLFVVCQKTGNPEAAEVADLFKLGVVCRIVKMLALSDGKMKLVLQGLIRSKVKEYRAAKDYLEADLQHIYPVDAKLGKKERNTLKRCRENLQLLVEYENLPEEIILVTESIEDAGMFADIIIAHYKLENDYAQGILEELDPLARLAIADKIMLDDVNHQIVMKNVKERAHDELTKGQRDYYLREQLKQIQKELGESEAGDDDLGELKAQLKKAGLPQQAEQESSKQLKRLSHMPAESSEYAMLRTYLEWIADLPWSTSTKEGFDLNAAKKILDTEHHGLEKAKDRILEYLSVQKLNRDAKGPILCFVGPPGVGKTSLARSVANCTNRKYFRMSLGGVRDEAEIRGHRRTYVGALPGKIIQGFKEAGSNNPVFVLDELDKLGADYRGDPAAALLEVLDPEQNKAFRDHYLNVDFDLSKCLFIATANMLDGIPEPLLDRLEVIYISGYTLQEKISIAQHYLIPRQFKEKGIAAKKIKFKKPAITFLIERYTREAGVRNLEREIGAIARKFARQIVENKKIKGEVTPELISDMLGAPRYDREFTVEQSTVGVSQGLAWTAVGGEVMPVEVSIAKGKGALHLTGQLGDVMQESAQTAMFYTRANTGLLGLDPDFHDKLDIHIHVPSGATPKDGPSAGITIATALISALSNRKVRRDVAMTGEMTLRGNVLAIGGLKEKALAALRYGVKRVIIPHENVKDLEEIPPDQRSKLEFVPVKHMSEVIDLVLMPVQAARKTSHVMTRVVKGHTVKKTR